MHEQLLALSKDATQLAIAAGGERIVSMRFAGQGHFTTGQAVLAAQSAADAREQRRAAWEERSMAFSGGLMRTSRSDRGASAPLAA